MLKLNVCICACHEMVHDQLLLTPDVVNCLVGGDSKWTDRDGDLDNGGSNDNCDNDNDDVDEARNDENGDNAIRGHPNDEMNRVDWCTTDMFENVYNSTVSVLTSQNQCRDQVATGYFGLNTTVEPDTLKFIDILRDQKENSVSHGGGSRHLSEEQKQDKSLNHWFKLAEENKNGFFVENDLLFRNERILGHSFKQLCVPQSRQKTVLDLAHNTVGAHMGIKRTREKILFSFT